jgi:hypothetical protein
MLTAGEGHGGTCARPSIKRLSGARSKIFPPLLKTELACTETTALGRKHTYRDRLGNDRSACQRSRSVDGRTP